MVVGNEVSGTVAIYSINKLNITLQNPAGFRSKVYYKLKSV